MIGVTFPIASVRFRRESWMRQVAALGSIHTSEAIPFGKPTNGLAFLRVRQHDLAPGPPAAEVSIKQAVWSEREGDSKLVKLYPSSYGFCKYCRTTARELSTSEGSRNNLALRSEANAETEPKKNLPHPSAKTDVNIIPYLPSKTSNLPFSSPPYPPYSTLRLPFDTLQNGQSRRL